MWNKTELQTIGQLVAYVCWNSKNNTLPFLKLKHPTTGYCFKKLENFESLLGIELVTIVFFITNKVQTIHGNLLSKH